MVAAPTLRVPNGTLPGYRYLWLKYVIGFDGAVHCARCLVGTYSQKVRLEATIDGLTLDEAAAPLLYLCGVSPRHATNLHVAMRPAPGAGFALSDYLGHEIRVEHAERLPIEALPRDVAATLTAPFHTCRNYQFGWWQLGPGQRAMPPGHPRRG